MNETPKHAQPATHSPEVPSSGNTSPSALEPRPGVFPWRVGHYVRVAGEPPRWVGSAVSELEYLRRRGAEGGP
jgi:hypothetical protein